MESNITEMFDSALDSKVKSFKTGNILNKLTKLGRCDRETIELANHSNDNIVRTAGRASK